MMLAIAGREIHGSGHPMMLERNSADVAAAIWRWLEARTAG
jgi:hypothetical protein